MAAQPPVTVGAPKESTAPEQLVLACVLIAAGGLLLGLQRQSTGELCGTGFSALGMGALMALVPLGFALARRGEGPHAPRDGLSLLSALCGFCGVAFLVSGILVPGGPWMFLQALLLFFVLTRRSVTEGGGLKLSHGTALLCGLFLLLRLWVTYQGARNQWAAVSIDVPVLSGWTFAPEWMRTISLGDFSAKEFSIPPVGLHFAHTMALWAVGFALVMTGLWLRHRSQLEYENDRIHLTIQELPPKLAQLVEKLLPEEEWVALGLHGLPARARRKRLSALTEERLRGQLEFVRAWASTPREEPTQPGFPAEIAGLFERYELPQPPPRLAPGPRPATLEPPQGEERQA